VADFPFPMLPLRREIAPEIRRDALLWVGYVAGALDADDYRSNLSSAGFEQIDIEATRIYRVKTHASSRAPGYAVVRRCLR